MARRNNLLKNVSIIGCGSFGGFLARRLSKYNKIKRITLIDYDKIEQKNLVNSIYKKDIGKFKVDVLKDIIKKDKPNLEIIAKNEKFIEKETIIDYDKFIENDKFIEKETIIDHDDYIIDCRDYTYDRSGIINVRFQISDEYLFINFEKYLKFNYHYGGEYSEIIKKSNIEDAAFLASSILILLDKKKTKNLIDDREYSFNLLEIYDYKDKNNEHSIMDKFIIDNLKIQKPEKNIIYNLQKIQITDIGEKSYDIIEMNKENEITFYFHNESKKFKPKSFIEQLGIFQFINDIVKKSKFNSYSIKIDYDKNFINVIPTKSAC